MQEDLHAIGRSCMALKARMAARTVTRVYDSALKPVGLRITQFTVLACIGSGDVNSISGLADYLAIERTTLTRNLQLLEKKGIISFEQGADSRARPVKLTEKGEELLQNAIPLWQDAQKTLQEKLGSDEWHMISSGLNILTKSA